MHVNLFLCKHFSASSVTRLVQVYANKSVCSFFTSSDPPMITDTRNTVAHLGKIAILRCEAVAVPPASFEWFRDDHR